MLTWGICKMKDSSQDRPKLKCLQFIVEPITEKDQAAGKIFSLIRNGWKIEAVRSVGLPWLWTVTATDMHATGVITFQFNEDVAVSNGYNTTDKQLDMIAGLINKEIAATAMIYKRSAMRDGELHYVH
jgi:hypothetical protein